MSDASDRERNEYVRLRERIHRRYACDETSISVRERSYTMTQVADVDVLLEEMASNLIARPEVFSQPYWGQVWDSARCLAEALAGDLAGSRVMDLGCGVGLPGVVAASAGAEVYFADAAEVSLLFARLNCWPWRERARFVKLNWLYDRIPGEFDLILASDLLYDRSDWNGLERFWQEQLTESGWLLLTEPRRPDAGDFVPWMRARGWELVQRTLQSEGQVVHLYLVSRGLGGGCPFVVSN